MKTELTKKIEYLIFKNTTKLGVGGCREVKIGTHKTKSLLTGEQEFVDYMTITSDGEISCYEIKSSMNDLKSTARLSFLGHKNFLVLPHTLYLQVANERWFLEKLENHSIGIIVLDENNKLRLLKKCKKKKLSIGTQTLLLESFARSAARDAKKLYDLEIKKLPKKRKHPMKTANLTVFFQTSNSEQLIENLKSTTTMISHTNAIPSKESSDYIIFVLYHPTDIEETLTEITSYPDTFINRAMYLDKAQSLEDNETVRTTIATTIINQFDNRHKTIYYQNEPISSASDYLKNKDSKNNINVVQFNNTLHCTLYSQTDEETYVFKSQD